MLDIKNVLRPINQKYILVNESITIDKVAISYFTNLSGMKIISLVQKSK